MSKTHFTFYLLLLFALSASAQREAVFGNIGQIVESEIVGDSIKNQNDSTAITYDADPLEIRSIADGDLLKYREDEAFDYEVAKAERTWWDDFTTWLGNLFRRVFDGIFGVEKAPEYFALFLRVIPYLLLGVLLYLLIRFFLNVNASGLARAKKQRGSVGLSEEENLIKNEDLQQLVQQALNEKNYRLAIRYYYLHLLQIMTEKDIISWQLQKTNDDYLREIQNPNLKPSFGKITMWYDHVWYGEFPIDEHRYKTAEKAFSSLKNTLNDHG